MEHKTFAITKAEWKTDDDGPGTLTGYGSTFGNVDAGNDVIVSGAFADALPGFLERGFVPVGHDWMGLPVATIAEAKEDDAGLWFSAEFHTTQAAQDARTVVKERIERGKFVGLSIGFMPDYENGVEFRDDGVRVLKRIKELAEISIVTVPMNREAGVASVKHGSLTTHHELSTAALDVAEDLLTRINDLGSLRGKMSDANRVRVERILASATRMTRQAQSILDAADDETEPQDKPKLTPVEMYRLRARLHDVDLLLADAG